MGRQFRYPLAANYNSRINENASTRKDGRMVNCFPFTVSNPVTGKRRVYCVKRPGWSVQTTLASGSKGTAIMSWTGQGNGNKVITAFGSTNSTIYDSANPLFVAVSGNGVNQVMTSTDGITWTARAESQANAWYGVAYGNGLFVAIANDGVNRVMTSPDGISWTNRTAAEANTWVDVTYGNGIFVAISSDGTNRVMTSTDGTTWVARAAAAANTWEEITYGNGLFVAVSSDGTNRVMTSTDGGAWVSRSAAVVSNWLSATYGNGVFVAVSAAGKAMSSPDGITWTERTASEANNWIGVSYGNGLFTAVASTGTNRVMTSTNGITWVARSASEANTWWNSVYGNGLYIAIAISGANRVMTSQDAITWTARAASEANNWVGIDYGTTSSSLGAITGYATGITETFVSSAPTLLISSSDNTVWNTSSDAVTGALTFTGDTHTNTTIDNISSTTGLVVGQLLTGSGIAASTRIASINSSTAITVDTATTATAAGVTITRAILGKIIDADFPGNASLTLAGTFAHMDGYAFIMTTDGKLWASDLNTVAAWTATSFASANAAPDKGIGCIFHRNMIVCFGRESMEFFYNSGATPFPLTKSASMTQKVGAISADAISAIGDTLFWCGSTPQGGLSIFSYDTGTSRISTPEIDAALIVVGTDKISLTTIRYYGRSFVQVTAGPNTYAYCIEEKSWFEIETTTPLAYKCAAVQVGGTLANYAISNVSTSGKVYVMDHSDLVFVDDTVAYTAKVQLSNDDMGTSSRKFFSSMAVIGDRSPVSSTATLTYSDDDYQTEVTAGTFDLSSARPILRRLGMSRSRAWSLSHSTNCAMRIEALEGEVEVGK